MQYLICISIVLGVRNAGTNGMQSGPLWNLPSSGEKNTQGINVTAIQAVTGIWMREEDNVIDSFASLSLDGSAVFKIDL